MDSARAQGRPRRGAAEVGRGKIIDRLQRAIRSGSDIDLSRKTLSAQAGVTPALISYYFPKKEMLLEEIASPIIQRYRLEMESILDADANNDEKLRKLVTLLVGLYSKDQHILDIYADVVRRFGREKSSEVGRMTAMLVDFLASWRGGASEDHLDAVVLQGAVWGMCRFAARADQKADADDDFAPLVSKVMNVVSLSFSRNFSMA